jgi:hypothetical protein
MLIHRLNLYARRCEWQSLEPANSVKKNSLYKPATETFAEPDSVCPCTFS